MTTAMIGLTAFGLLVSVAFIILALRKGGDPSGWRGDDGDFL
jgi:hypothetical protein